MGKPKLRSSIKALHQAIFNFRPPGAKTMTWVCVQQAKTNSFREVYKSFNSMYYSSSSSTSSGLCSLNEETDRVQDSNMLLIGPHSDESFTTSSSSFTTTETEDSNPVEFVIKGQISSKRFFFSPCTTKSIMEEADSQNENEMGLVENTFSDDPCLGNTETDAAEVIMEVGFCRESVTMAMASVNPYMDFRVSMEEMIEAHGLREWSCLQDLLHCYLRLNDKQTHKTIVLAFVDLLMNLIAEEPNDSDSRAKLSCFPFPLCLEG